MHSWLSVSLTAPAEAAEAVSCLLLEAGPYGVWFEDSPSEEIIRIRAGFPPGLESRLMARLPAALTELTARLSMPLSAFSLEIELKPAEDYRETWKKNLKPLSIGPKLMIVPGFWTEPLKLGPQTQVLKLDPGQAFGSGQHQTTFLCLTLLHSLSDQKTKPVRILDLGSGSGILALAAALLFPQAEIIGLDSDPGTLEAAESNLKINGLSGRITFSSTPVKEMEPGFDLILGNLSLAILTGLASELARILTAEGHLVASGLLDGQTASLAETFRNHGLGILSHLGQDDWSALLMGRRGTGSPRVLVARPGLFS
jgi:ribosomal protein L11 methyltransferase